MVKELYGHVNYKMLDIMKPNESLTEPIRAFEMLMCLRNLPRMSKHFPAWIVCGSLAFMLHRAHLHMLLCPGTSQLSHCCRVQGANVRRAENPRQTPGGGGGGRNAHLQGHTAPT